MLFKRTIKLWSNMSLCVYVRGPEQDAGSLSPLALILFLYCPGSLNWDLESLFWLCWLDSELLGSFCYAFTVKQHKPIDFWKLRMLITKQHCQVVLIPSTHMAAHNCQ